MRITVATQTERREYLATNPAHPLHGWAIVRGERLPVEYLGEGRGEPNYEALAPEGFHFWPDATHSLLGTSLKDLRSRLVGQTFAACGEDC